MLRAKKSLGQNFLVDERVIERIVRAAGVRPDEIIIEIGPGRGALTARLVEQAAHVFAIEFDRELVPLLRERFATRVNLTLIEADALDVNFCDLLAPQASAARVVANLPYYISTAMLQRLIAQRHCLSEMILMLQREVVERIVAVPGAHERGYLSVLVEAYCEASPLFDVAPGSFRPAPKVWSTVVQLKIKPHTLIEVVDEDLLWQTVSAGFAQRRKTLANNLRAAAPAIRTRVEQMGGANLALQTAGIEPQRRAETLTLTEWTQLTRALAGQNTA